MPSEVSIRLDIPGIMAQRQEAGNYRENPGFCGIMVQARRPQFYFAVQRPGQPLVVHEVEPLPLSRAFGLPSMKLADLTPVYSRIPAEA